VANVEFTVVVEQRTIYVHLHYVGPLGLLPLSLFHQRVELVDLVDYGYASTLVAVLAGLDDPDVAGLAFNCFSLLLGLALLLLDLSGSALVVLDEASVFWIFGSLADVEGEREVVEDLLADQPVVLLQIVEESLLVAEIEVVLQMVMNTVSIFFHLIELFGVLFRLKAEIPFSFSFVLAPVLLV
jgi:hypothetical protein